jgi:hypothetical protein
VPQQKWNHFIPEFLLNRFCSRQMKKKKKKIHWIWQIGRSGLPREVITRKAAASNYFYGGQETGVENALANAEGRFGALLLALDRGEAAENYSEDLRLFVWTLAVRTSAIRGQLGVAVNDLFDQMATTITPDQAQTAVLERLDVALDGALEDELRKFPVQQQAIARNNLMVPEIRQQIFRLGGALVRSTDVAGMFRWMLRELCSQNIAASASKDGQIRGLSSRLASGMAPDSFSPDYWYIYESTTTDLVLGDGCVFATAENGSVGSLFRLGQSWNAMYCPISPSKFLVGTWSLTNSVLSASEINKISAELSFSYIYARSDGEAERSLAQRIGSTAPFISQEDLTRLVSERE